MNLFNALLSRGDGAGSFGSDLTRPSGEVGKSQNKRDVDVEICRAQFGALSVLGLATGGVAGAAAGTGACVAGVITAPAASLCGTLGGLVGASAGALGGGMTALNTPACREGVVKKARPTGGVPPMPPSLPNCPAHGVAHSCAHNPTPARGGSARGGRALPSAAHCSGGSCSSGSCGCR